MVGGYLLENVLAVGAIDVGSGGIFGQHQAIVCWLTIIFLEGSLGSYIDSTGMCSTEKKHWRVQKC